MIDVYLGFSQMLAVNMMRALRDDPKSTDIRITVFLPWTYDEGTEAAIETEVDDLFDGPINNETLRAHIAKYAPETLDQCEMTAANQLPTTESINLRVAQVSAA